MALLIQKKRIDILLSYPEFASITENQNQVSVFLSNSFSSKDGMGYELFNTLNGYLEIFRMSFLNRQLRLILTKRDCWIDDLEKILRLVHQLAVKHGISNESL